MKSPLNIAETVKQYNLDDELKRTLIALDRFIWQDCEIKTVHQLLTAERNYQEKRDPLSYCYDNEVGEFGPVFMNDGTMDYLCKGSFQRISKCLHDAVGKCYLNSGLTELETVVVRSFLAEISGLYRIDAYHGGIPPFVQSVCKILNKGLSKLPVYYEGYVVRACNEYDKTDFNVGDVFAPGYCLTTSADLEWKDTSENRYFIMPSNDEKTTARAIFKVHDNTEKQVTFLQEAHFRVIDIKEWGEGKKEIVMEEYLPIEINLIADMADLMRNELQEIGYKVNILDNRELMIYYFTTCDRIINKHPRNVHEAAGIVVPPSRQAGYDALKERFVKGESVMPFMSKQIKGLKFQDKMLFDWGIHHFHLHDVIEPDGFVKQKDELVYAIVEKDDVYFIDVLGHDYWSDRDLLEKVLANWPHLLDPFRVDGTPVVDFDTQAIGQLREANVNLILTLSDGHGYIGRGMGMTAAGTSANATITANRMASDLLKIEKQVRDKNTHEDGRALVFSLFRDKEEIYLTEKSTKKKCLVFKYPSLKMKLS